MGSCGISDPGIQGFLRIFGRQLDSLNIVYTDVPGASLIEWIENNPGVKLKKLSLDNGGNVTPDRTIFKAYV